MNRMKLSFSTLGCPEWNWNEILATAKDMGFDGIEIRGVGNELYAPGIKEFSDINIKKTKEKLSEIGVKIVCLTSASYLYQTAKVDRYIAEGKAYIDTARALGVPYIRVLGDKDPQPSAIIDDDTVASALEVLGEYAAGKDVMVLIETNGAYADTKRLSSLIQRLSCSNVGVLWDIHHPYRYFKESPKQTYDNIGRFIRYVHVKDSVYNENGSLQYKMMGYGDLPVKECIRI